MIRSRFEWGARGPIAYDCIGLANSVRVRNGLRAIDLPQLSWVYSDYPTLEDAPLDLVDRLAHQLADPVEVPEEYDLAIITNQSGRSCLGTLTKGSLLFFAGERAVMVEIDRALNHHSDIRWVRLKESFLEVE